MSFRLQLGEVSVAAGETTDREPFLRRVAAAPDPAYKTRADRTALAADPTFSAAGQLLRLLLRLRQLADDRLAPRIPFR